MPTAPRAQLKTSVTKESMLPSNLVAKVLAHCDMDTRIAFKVKPNRLDTTDQPDWRPHGGVVYIRETGTLFNFVRPNILVVSRPVTLDIECDGLSIFNLYNHAYTTCTYTRGASELAYCSRESWATDLKVLIK